MLLDLLRKLEENTGSIGYSIGAVDDWEGVGWGKYVQ